MFPVTDVLSQEMLSAVFHLLNRRLLLLFPLSFTSLTLDGS